MRATVNIKSLVSATAFIALAGVFLAAAVALNDAQISSTRYANNEPSASVTGALDAELARCNAVGPEAANDPVCDAIWEANRKRFFESRKPPSRTEVPKATPQSPTIPSASPAPAFDESPRTRAQ